jgi:hypothetical protein
MGGRLRRWWPLCKALLTLVILIVIGRQFARDLQRPELWLRPLHLGWLILSGLLYLVGLGFSALYWDRLLGYLGARPPLLTALRAYYIGHLGKYVPGKAWAVFLRATLVRGGGVRLGLAALTSFYEVLTTMAAGVLLAAGLFALLAPDTGTPLDWNTLVSLACLEPPAEGGVDRTTAVLLSLLLLGPIGLSIVPPLFNWLVHHLSLPFRSKEAEVPRIRFAWLVEGLFLTSVGWLLLGISMEAAFHGILGPELPWRGEARGRLAAIMGVSYVAGFVILLAPSGLGVREFFLTLFLTPELVGFQGMDEGEARGTVVLAVLVLRLVWTVAELLLAVPLYWLGLKAISDQRSAISQSGAAPSCSGKESLDR